MSEKFLNEWLETLANDTDVTSNKNLMLQKEAMIIRKIFIKKNLDEDFNISLDGLNKIIQAATDEKLIKQENKFEALLNKFNVFIKISIPVLAASGIFIFILFPNIMPNKKYSYQIASLADPSILEGSSINAKSISRSIDMLQLKEDSRKRHDLIFKKKIISVTNIKKMTKDIENISNNKFAYEWIQLLEINSSNISQEIIFDARLLTEIIKEDQYEYISVKIYNLTDPQNKLLQEQLEFEAPTTVKWFITIGDGWSNQN